MNTNTRRTRSMVWQITRTKHIFRLWSVPPLHHKPKASTGKNLKTLDSRKNLLIGGESSDGQGSTTAAAAATQVPRGFLAVYVGPKFRRFVIPASYLCMPDFRVLMDKAAEEFGYEQVGGLRIPCEEEDFEDVLRRCLAMHQVESKPKPRKEKK